jgi:excisionase family DNA binding protein
MNMNFDPNKPLYALTIGEFIELLQSNVKSAVPQMTEPEFDKEEHFNIAEVAAFLNCTKMTVHNYKQRGLPYYRVGRKLLFKKSEVLEFMRRNVTRFYGSRR